VEATILLYAAVGFAAQMVDGSIGMAYGLVSTSVLLSTGVAPAPASASVHLAELFTTAASGLSHWRIGNVDQKLLWRLAIPGMVGGGAGAYLLTMIDGETMRPIISAYLLGMGGVILWKALRKRLPRKDLPNHIAPLGLFGAFIDAIGGGGWGPIVTSTLVGRGMLPRVAIGSVNFAEFFVTMTVSATFVTTIGFDLWPVVLGLVLGGVLAAPMAALVTRRIPARAMMIVVGLVIILLSVRGLARAIGLDV
jgi:uncharacterized membrane protein YfcA